MSPTGNIAAFIRSINRVFVDHPLRRVIPILASLGLSMIVLSIAFASVAITAATGGDNLVVGQFATLSGPSLAEQTAGDIGVGTIILQVPAGFVFDTTDGVVVASVTDQGDCHGRNHPLRLGLAAPSTTEIVTAASSSITIHVKQRSSGSCRGTITWSGISVKATQLTSGDITNAGSSVIVGAPAGTSFGHLSTAPTPTATATSTPTPTVTSTPTATSTATMTPTPALTPVFALNWIARADLPLARSNLGLVGARDGRIYAVGGKYSSPTRPYVAANDVQAYDPSTDSWTSLAGLLTPRDSLGAAAASNGKIYAIGGRGPYAGAISSLALVEEYDPSTNTWTRKADMPTARYGLAAVTGPDGKIYAIGGYNESLGYLGTVEVYDPSTDTWSTRSNMPTARAYLGLASSPATNGKIYAVGGEVNGAALDTVEVYDPAADTWSTAASLPVARSGLGLVYGGDNRVYAIGGLGSAANGYLSLVDAYDPVANAWSSATALSTARAYLGAAAATNGKIYAVGGYDGTSYLAANEEGTITVASP